MSAKIWQIMIKKLTGEQKILESRLVERKRRASGLKSKIKNLDSYIQDYLTYEQGDTLFDRRQLLLRESTMVFASQLSMAKLKLEEALEACNSECEVLRNDLSRLLIESSKYQRMDEIYSRRQHSLAEQAERKLNDELSTLNFLRSNIKKF